MNRTLRVALLLAASLLVTSPSPAQVIVPWAVRGTVDTDGDSNPNLVDNAPGVANNQADSDGDGIGDVIDPTPMSSNPVLGLLAIGIYPVPSITAGSNAVVDYTVFTSGPFVVPPGSYGHVDIDFGADTVYDATYFGPLSAGIDQIVIPPSLFSSLLWDLNQPGTYLFQSIAYAPGTSSQGVGAAISSVEVLVPEPASLLGAGAWLLLLARKERSPSD